MRATDNILIGQMLIEHGVITPEQLEAGLEEQKKTKDFICTTLIKLGFNTEEKIFGLLAQKLGIVYRHLGNKEIDSSIIKKVPAKFASHYKIIPIEFNDNLLVVAMADPLDIRTLDDLRLLLDLEVEAVLASETEIDIAIRKYYGVGADILEKIVAKSQPATAARLKADNVEDLTSLAEEASVINFVNQILTEAIKDRATDIHLEPYQDELRTRFRIDGMLYDINIPDSIKYFHTAIVSRFKIMAQLDIAEHRLPQDGRFKIRLESEELDLRVSILPTAFGEEVHVRILNASSFLELEKLGLCESDLKIIERMIDTPHGIIFTTGPTGSGKSTTLYASLARISSSAVKIITIEDPIEYQLKGVNQMQVAPKIGFSFANGLRHILRHDPDVIMVGEVRDCETAEISIRAALTGHLVFSTLHTNDAAGAVTRLLDMGIEPYLVASSMECLIAQRLVRLICPNCKVAIQGERKREILDQIKDLNIQSDKIEFFEGKGCKECRNTGYRGRTGIYEVLVVSEAIRELILKRSSSQQIKQKAISCGMRTLRQDGLEKVFQGLTTFTEVMRVTQQEELSL